MTVGQPAHTSMEGSPERSPHYDQNAVDAYWSRSWRRIVPVTGFLCLPEWLMIFENSLDPLGSSRSPNCWYKPEKPLRYGMARRWLYWRLNGWYWEQAKKLPRAVDYMWANFQPFEYSLGRHSDGLIVKYLGHTLDRVCQFASIAGTRVLTHHTIIISRSC